MIPIWRIFLDISSRDYGLRNLKAHFEVSISTFNRLPVKLLQHAIGVLLGLEGELCLAFRREKCILLVLDGRIHLVYLQEQICVNLLRDVVDYNDI